MYSPFSRDFLSPGMSARGKKIPPVRVTMRLMRRRSAIRNICEYGLAIGVLKSLQWTPLPMAYGLARAYARLLDRVMPRLRCVALRNLSLALPELGAAKHGEIVDGVFRSIARLLVTF